MPDKDSQLPLPPVDANDAAKQIGALTDDFDAVLAAEENAARGRDMETFTGATVDDDDDIAGIDERTVAAKVPGQEDELAKAREKRAQEQADDVTKPIVEEKPGETVEDKPAAKIAAEKPATPAKPGEEKGPARPWTFAKDEQIALGPDRMVTREQLDQRLGLTQTALDEANGFRNIFRCTKEQAETIWKPIMDGIQKDPTRAQFFDSCLGACDDPHLRNYVERAISNFKALDAAGQVKRDGAPAGGAADGAPVVDSPAAREALRIATETQRVQNEQLKMQRDSQLQAAAIAVDREWSDLKGKYSVLEDDNWRTFVAQHAFRKMQGNPQAGIAGDPSYTLTRAADDLAAKYLTPLSKPVEQAREPVKVPPLNGSTGARAGGSRRAPTRGQAYENGDDAAEAFYQEFPTEDSFR